MLLQQMITKYLNYYYCVGVYRYIKKFVILPRNKWIDELKSSYSKRKNLIELINWDWNEYTILKQKIICLGMKN